MKCGRVCSQQGCSNKCLKDNTTCNGIHYCREHHPDHN